jgi:rhamnulokinase
MVRELRGALRECGRPDTDEPVRLARVILDSLARRYADVVESIERLTGHPVPGIHIVGGGSLNAYLNQATADASGRPVLAGPVEATAIGNLLVQSMAAGEIASIEEGRRLVASSLRPVRYEPRRHAG